MQVAEAAMEAADAQFGNVHDYVGDKEKAEEEARIQAEAEEKFAKSGEGKAQAKLEEAQRRAEEGNAKGAFRLSKKDIERWNAEHGKDEQIKKIERSMFATEKEFRDARVKQNELRYQAKQDKLLNKLEQNLEDERNGIHHGVGASIKRKLIGGEKTWQQKAKEAENLEKAQKDKEAVDNNVAKIDVKAIQNMDGVRNALDTMMKTKAGKNARKVYDDYIEGERLLGRDTTIEVQREALAKMKEATIKNAEKTFTNAENKVAETQKGMLYTAGKYGKKLVRPAADKAAVIGKWAANKGHTFLLGHTDQDKETAKALLAKRAELAKKVSDIENVPEQQIKQQYAKFMQDYIDAKQKATVNALNTYKDPKDQDAAYKSEMNKFMRKNQQLLDQSAFKYRKVSDLDRFEKEMKANGIMDAALKNENVDAVISKLYKSDDKSNKTKAEKWIETQVGNMKGDKKHPYNAAVAELQKFDANNKRSLKKAEQMLNGKHIRSIGAGRALGKFAVDGVSYLSKKVYNSKISQEARRFNKVASTKVAQIATNIWNNPKVQKNINTAKHAAKQVEKSVKFIAQPGVKAYHWTQDRLAGKAAAQAKTKANAVENAEKRRARNAHIEQIIGETLVKKEQQTKQEIINKLEKRLKQIENNPKLHSGLKAAELERLLAKYKTDSLNPAEKKQFKKYLQFSTSNKNAQHKQIQQAVKKQVQANDARKELDKNMAELESRTKREYTNILKTELAKVGFGKSQIDNIIGQVKRGTTTEVYKQARRAAMDAVAAKHREFQKAQGNGTARKNLVAEINQLNNLVRKLQSTDAAYKSQMKKVQTEIQKVKKKLKEKKAEDALRQSINNQTNNPFNKNP